LKVEIMAIDISSRALLRECVQRQAPELLDVLAKVGNVPLSDDEREDLREAVAAELDATGIDYKGGHNPRGIALDNLIDVLGHV
jgi:hypothetical protein